MFFLGHKIDIQMMNNNFKSIKIWIQTKACNEVFYKKNFDSRKVDGGAHLEELLSL